MAGWVYTYCLSVAWPLFGDSRELFQFLPVSLQFRYSFLDRCVRLFDVEQIRAVGCCVFAKMGAALIKGHFSNRCGCARMYVNDTGLRWTLLRPATWHGRAYTSSYSSCGTRESLFLFSLSPQLSWLHQLFTPRGPK